ncbi:recombinase XerD [Flavobacterium columnare]|uniref:tyrosine-type recombinase/integrase n=1 Tax=Flavobacterium columnare TaxID=996 RepID=UPI0018964C5D|nr:tyrosine-type recombinase/integrase [Flavobacterium columnare]MBF6653861.1 recombinase XerD [Flavobacterium columnare]MBF6656657.1 recombinase XerD [Flavobacterium columnare]MBF6659302.1 recombinase XerD [Flavobacterium columnare]
MKNLILENESYREIIKDFKNWLDILGYADTTLYNLPNHLKEFLHYLENENINKINLINVQTIKDYYNYLKTRDNQTRDGGLSKAYLNKHIQALFKFNDYLKEHNAKPLPIHLKREEYSQRDSLQVLTQEEIKQLFKATNSSNQQERIRKRDKVILVLLYSCGLRRNEAINLEIKDILFDKELLFVKKGKNYKQRYVPINQYNLKIIEEYIYDYRPAFKNYKNTENLLINYRGKPLQGQSLCNRLKILEKVSNIRKAPPMEGLGRLTPHILRHSIATHLLEKGANIETISKFLGHSSLESTQIYTHLLEDKAKTNNDEQLHNILRETRLRNQEFSNIPKGNYSPRYMDE